MRAIDPINTEGKTAEERKNLLVTTCKSERLISIIPRLEAYGFFTCPASTKYHGNYEGGLFDHCVNVAQVLDYMNYMNITEPFGAPDSPVVIGILHDITKLGKYKRTQEGTYEYNNSNLFGNFGGHGADSLIKAALLMQLTDEEAYCIRYHMGAYEKEAWDLFEEAMNLYPNVLWTHTADMVASKLMGV